MVGCGEFVDTLFITISRIDLDAFLGAQSLTFYVPQGEIRRVNNM